MAEATRHAIEQLPSYVLRNDQANPDRVYFTGDWSGSTMTGEHRPSDSLLKAEYIIAMLDRPIRVS
jgi:hypothetical protein